MAGLFAPTAVGATPGLRPNVWDLVALPLILGALVLLAYGAAQMATPYNVGDPLPLTLDPLHLPYYLLRTALRMGAGLVLSLLFTLVYATIAAKSANAGRILIPALDILQSIPILGFLSITVTGFISLFPGSLLGMECAAIFAIFTSQAWNMTFSLYQSLRTVPADLTETAAMLHLSPWRRFWRLEMPFAMPSLVWNMMVSVSGGWFFVVASEAISVSGQKILLPGVGSYIALAIADRNLPAIGWAIATMLVAIIIYDQVMFRPLVAWSEKFKFEETAGEEAPESWLLTLLQRTRLLRQMVEIVRDLVEAVMIRIRSRGRRIVPTLFRVTPRVRWPGWLGSWWWSTALALGAAAAAVSIGRSVSDGVGWGEVVHVLLLGLATATRVVVLILLASLVWVPVGVWVGLRPRLAQRLQWIAQFLAAFPANLMFPIVVAMIVRFDLSVDIWVSPLMILGTQWYLLFNVIAGAAALPSDLRAAAGNLGLRGWLRWKRLYLPGIFPAYITGAIAASGGSWNASIVAELVTWGNTTLTATGLGAYIAHWTHRGDFPRIVLGIGVMCLFVMGLNRFLWRRLYVLAEQRLRLD
ncbi:MAG: ABC transporter permease subunit [Alphaproteobacteria bacterium]